MMKSILFGNCRIIIKAGAGAGAGAFSRPLNPLIHSLNPNSLISSPLPMSFSSLLPFSRFLSSCVEASSSPSSSPDIQKLFANKYQSRLYDYTVTKTTYHNKFNEMRDIIEKVLEDLFNDSKSSAMKSLMRYYSHLDWTTSQHDLSTRPFYESYNDWMNQLQTTVFILALRHWLETGHLISRKQVERKLGMRLVIRVHVKDYLLGICLLCSKMPDYVEQQGQLRGNRKICSFLKSVQDLFKKLDLSNFEDGSFLERINAVRNGDYLRKVELKVENRACSYASSTPGMIKLFEETYSKEFFKYSEIDKGIRLWMDSVQNIMNQMQEDVFVHGLCPVPDALEKAKFHIEKLKCHYHDLALQRVHCELSEWVPPYSEHINEWRNQRQATVSILAFLHWLETGKLISRKEIATKLGFYSLKKHIFLDKINYISGLGSLEGLVEFDIIDYLVGICLMSSKLPEYAEHLVNTAVDYNCLRNVLKFSKDIQALFNTLSPDLLEDEKMFNAVMKGYDVHRVESICLYNNKVLDAAVLPDSMDDNNNHMFRIQMLHLVLVALICLI
ncbi:Translin family protein [Thalictrum thalictroides]|uniref:Translin family protein n=1 Tax=Thalictrum thalictroides TaxID=46969 RepID=A0A7J6V9E3_THATH|nr:Translin family protein [Thalictrum thalictroides]